MPTITLSWTDLALVALTAGVIGGVALAGSQTRSTSSSSSNPSLINDSSNKSKGNKKKKAKSKKNESSTASSSALPSPKLAETKVESVSVSKPPVSQKKKKAKEEESYVKKGTPVGPDAKEFPPLGSSTGKSTTSDSAKKEVAEKVESNPTRPFAERMQVPARKTKVDDMIDEEVEKPIKMARVMKIVEESSGSSLAEETEVEDGWEKVPDGRKSRGGKSITLKMSTVSTPTTAPPGSSASHTTTAVTKRQRQNAKKKEAAKAAKEAEEAERLGRLSAHKRQQERIRMNEQSSGGSNRSNKSKEVSGGMKASIADDGKLIWE